MVGLGVGGGSGVVGVAEGQVGVVEEVVEGGQQVQGTSGVVEGGSHLEVKLDHR